MQKRCIKLLIYSPKCQNIRMVVVIFEFSDLFCSSLFSEGDNHICHCVSSD